MARRNSMEICECLWLACPMDCSSGSLDMDVERQRTKSKGTVKKKTVAEHLKSIKNIGYVAVVSQTGEIHSK